MLRLGFTGNPTDVTGRLAELAQTGADTFYVADIDHIRLLDSRWRTSWAERSAGVCPHPGVDQA